MRRLVFVFLMLLLPLQSTWAAAAGVCRHEAGGAHFGHHEHQHKHDSAAAKADAADTHETSDGNAPGNHPDCQVCHGVGIGQVPAVSDVGASWVPDRQTWAYDRHVPEPPLESFLRPPLTLVA